MMRSAATLVGVARIQRAAHKAAFLLQQQHFEKIAHRLRMADDVMADRLAAEILCACRAARLEYREFARRIVANRSRRRAAPGADRKGGCISSSRFSSSESAA